MRLIVKNWIIYACRKNPHNPIPPNVKDMTLIHYIMVKGGATIL